MRDHIITENYAPGDPESRYLRDVAERITSTLPNLQITVPYGLGLCMVLSFNTIVFKDGFVINDIRVGHMTIGEVEALLVVAALDPDSEHSYEWWADQRWRPRDTDSEERCYQELLERIRRSPDVASVS